MHRHIRNHKMVALVALVLALCGFVVADARAAESKPAGTPGAAQPVDLNRAGIDELATVPGIGKALAQRIVDFREQNGPFARVEDLLKVKGIGEKSFEKMRPYVTVSAKR